MRNILMGALAVVVLTVALFGVWWHGAAQGWWGSEIPAGEIRGARIPAEVIAARTAAERLPGQDPDSERQILFGDWHVHTTWSTDAFQWALPIAGGRGAAPIADACDFARYCAQLDFWAITDHAEAGTPWRWAETKKSVRQCQAIAGGEDNNPDLISFVGFEWTQVGRTPEEHFGHKNVIFKGLADGEISARPIASAGVTTDVLRETAEGVPPALALRDPFNAEIYHDFNRFIENIQAVPGCDPATPSKDLPANCYEAAATPGELVARLESQGLEPLIIPHGTAWGFYTPAGTDWRKALEPKERPGVFSLIEIFSGHGNSEEYRSWREAVPSPARGGCAAPTSGRGDECWRMMALSKSSCERSGGSEKACGAAAETAREQFRTGGMSCPEPRDGFLPSCWRAGEIMEARCLKAGRDAQDCAALADDARLAVVNMSIAGHTAISGENPEDWLDGGQCTDCFLPAFNHRPLTSVQAGLAERRFAEDGGADERFIWGFIGSSDNHRARPGTGYKQVDRRVHTEANGPATEADRVLLLGAPTPETLDVTVPTLEQLMAQTGFQLTEFERQSSYFLTGGLAAAHAEGRSREAIWAAMQRREVYATSGQRMLLWFDLVDTSGARAPMGSLVNRTQVPTFEVRALGAFAQKPGCPDFVNAGLDGERIQSLCSGECYNPTDVRKAITRIEVVRIRPKVRPDEPLDDLIENSFIVHQCEPSPTGCVFRFSDPDFARDRRDAIYYVRAIQEPEPTINADPLKCEKDEAGRCRKVNLCYGDYRSGASDCLAPAEPRAWSSPIYVNYAPAG